MTVVKPATGEADPIQTEGPAPHSFFPVCRNRRNVQQVIRCGFTPGHRLGRDSMYRNILYPTGGSDGAAAALDTVYTGRRNP